MSDGNKGLSKAQQDVIYSAYLGICVLQTMTRVAGLALAQQRAKEILVELSKAFPFITERIAKGVLRNRTEHEQNQKEPS